MQTRRTFLKGLLSSVAAGALIKNGIIRPEQVIAELRPWTIDMAAHTWRENWNEWPLCLWKPAWNVRTWTMLRAYLGDGTHHTAVWDRALSAQEVADLSAGPTLRRWASGYGSARLVAAYTALGGF